jgi:zinc protease
MFQGSDHVATGQHYRLVEDAGGEVTANANEDRTAFSETLPSNQLGLGLWLEADRMRSLKITEQGFGSERESAKQERQMRVENQPYGAAFLDGMTAAFDSSTCFPYAHSVMGSPDDLDAAQLADVQAFFKAHYGPNHATLVVSGDFEASETRRLIQTYYADIPRSATAAEVRCETSYAAGERTRQWPDPLATLPAVITSYRIPPHSDADSPALDLLARIAGQGASSRLERALKGGEHVAVQAASEAPGWS